MDTVELSIEAIYNILEYTDSITKIAFSQISSEFYEETLKYINTNVYNALEQRDFFSLVRFPRSEWNSQGVHLTDICKLSDLNLLIHFVNVRGTENINGELISALYLTAKLGNHGMFWYLRSMIPDSRIVSGYLIHYACLGGNIEIFNASVELFELTKQFNAMNFTAFSNYNAGHTLLRAACRGGNPIIVQGLLNTGFCQYDDGFLGACEGGQLDIAKLMVEMMDDHIYTKYGGTSRIMNLAARTACAGGHREIVEYLFNMDIEYHYTSLFYSSCGCPNADLPLYLLGLLSTPNIDFLSSCLDNACQAGHYQLAAELLDRGAVVYDHTINIARDRRHVDLVNLLINHADKRERELLESLTGNEVSEAIKKCGRISESTVNTLYDGRHYEILSIIIKNGFEVKNEIREHIEEYMRRQENVPDH